MEQRTSSKVNYSLDCADRVYQGEEQPGTLDQKKYEKWVISCWKMVQGLKALHTNNTYKVWVTMRQGQCFTYISHKQILPEPLTQEVLQTLTCLPHHGTAQIRFQNQLSRTADLHPFLEVQHLLRAVPISQMGKWSHKGGTWQSWHCKPVPHLTHLQFISCSSFPTAGNINRLDSHTGHHPWGLNINFPLPFISAHLFNCQIFKAEIWVCIYDIWPAGKFCVHIWCDINNKWDYHWYFSIFSKRPILLDFLGLQGPI